MHRNPCTFVWTVLALLFVLGRVGLAQQPASPPQTSQELPTALDPESPAPHPRWPHMHHRMGHGHRMDIGARMSRHLERLTQQLSLSDAQRTQIQTLQLTYAKEAIRGRADLAVMHLDLRQLFQADQPDLTQVKGVLQQMASKETELRLAHITMMQNIRTLLTPEQRQKWRAMHTQRMRQGPHEQ